MAAVAMAKRQFKGAVVVRATETAAPVEDSFSEFIDKIKQSFEGKIRDEDKIATIRQISVMTDAGIPINDTLEEIAKNTENPKLK
ncbi:MAG: type II secretion system F family protein, partial [Campylobacterales bacterium]|nr:type II secretion system F family protein [Campylobacterales bacterium]